MAHSLKILFVAACSALVASPASAAPPTFVASVEMPGEGQDRRGVIDLSAADVNLDGRGDALVTSSSTTASQRS